MYFIPYQYPLYVEIQKLLLLPGRNIDYFCA